MCLIITYALLAVGDCFYNARRMSPPTLSGEVMQ